MTKRHASKRREHISDEDVAAFLEDRLSPQKKDEIIAHLAACPDCRQLVAAIAVSRKFVGDTGSSS